MNLQDYVRWRGDLRFAERPFNPVDNLVLSALSYLDLAGLVPTEGAITVAEAAGRLEAGEVSRSADERRLTVVPSSLLADLGRSARFGSAQLSRYVDVVDDGAGTQFAAVTIALEDGTDYVAFRGTDNTIVGWREDFMMSFQVVPAQLMATDYLAELMRGGDRPVRVGGHSKGGALAVYAAMTAPGAVPVRIIAVYDNDGPGLSPEVVDTRARQRLAGRIHKTVPEFSVIGMLFDRNSPVRVVGSSARGLMQHDLMTWEIEGADLREVPGVSRRADAVNVLVDRWLAGSTCADRREFTSAFFEALGAGGATLVVEVGATEYGSVEAVLLALRRTRHRTRRLRRLGLRAVWQTLRSVDYRTLLRDRSVLRAAVMSFLGLYFVLTPALAVQVMGSFATLVAVVAVLWRLVRHVLRFRGRQHPTWLHASATLAVLAAVVMALMRIDVFIAPANALLGLALLARAWSSARRAQELRRYRGRAVTLGASAVLSLLLGATALASASTVMPFFVAVVGQYLLVSGLVELFLEVGARTRRGVQDVALARALEGVAGATGAGEGASQPLPHRSVDPLQA